MKENTKNAPEVVATEVVANEVRNTSERPRPEIVVLSEKVYFQTLEGSKYATLPYEMDGTMRVVKCGEVKDLETLKGFKVGPYKYDIPQCGVVLEFKATYNEVAEDGQRFKGSHTYFDAVATFADGTTRNFDGETGDTIRKAVGLPVNGTTKSPFGVAYRHFSKSEAKGYIEACNNEEVTKAYNQLRGILGKLFEAEKAAEAKAKAEKEAEAKAKAKADTAAKHIANASDLVLAQEMAKRMNITIEQVLKMLGH